jgi:hypothetical protein
MQLYKFKSLQNFDHIADIFLNERFYAAFLPELNDPMEVFVGYTNDVGEDLKQKFNKQLQETRACCLSETRSNVLLWAHYADGFRGICIEVDIQKHNSDKVRYVPFKLRIGKDNLENKGLLGVSQWFCKQKMKEWEYEQEVRVYPMNNNEYIDRCLVEIKAVYLGLRIPPALKEVLLRIVPEKIKVFETDISEETGEVVATHQIKWDQLTATASLVECNEPLTMPGYSELINLKA